MKYRVGRLAIISSVVLFCCLACNRGERAKTAPTDSSPREIHVGKGPDALFLTPDGRFLYVANVEDTLISVIDTRTDSVSHTVNSVDFPWGFTRLGNTNSVAVSGWAQVIDVIDFTTHQIVRSNRYDSNLAGITSLPDGSTIFVVASREKKVLKVDAATLRVTDDYPTGSGADGIGLSRDAEKLYVANTQDGTISIINISSKESSLIRVGGKPELIHRNHDHSLLYISNFTANKVHIVDTETDAIVHEITDLNGPEEAVLSPSTDLLYVVNFNNSRVYVFDGKGYNNKPHEYMVGKNPIGILPTHGDTKLYVSNYGSNTITVIRPSCDRYYAKGELSPGDV